MEPIRSINQFLERDSLEQQQYASSGDLKRVDSELLSGQDWPRVEELDIEDSDKNIKLQGIIPPGTRELQLLSDFVSKISSKLCLDSKRETTSLVSEQSKDSVVNQLQFWQDQCEHQSLQIADLKVVIHFIQNQLQNLHAALAEKEASVNELIEKSRNPSIDSRQALESENSESPMQKKYKLPTEGCDSSANFTPTGSVSHLAKPSSVEKLARQEDGDEVVINGKLVTIKAESGQMMVKCGTVPALLERLLDPSIHGNII